MNKRIARVYVNSIEVGSLPADQYEEIIRKSYRDWKNYFLQLFNAIAVIWKFVYRTIFFIPVLWFGMAVIFAISDPSVLTDFFSQIQNNQPEQNTAAFIHLLTISLCLSTFGMVGISIYRGPRSFGFVNMFGWDINRKIRTILEVPAMGDVNVMVIDNTGAKVIYGVLDKHDNQ